MGSSVTRSAASLRLKKSSRRRISASSSGTKAPQPLFGYHRRVVRMRRLLVYLFLGPPLAAAGNWSLEKLFTRPFIWGTSPTEITWSKQGHVLLFLWNADGNRFRDLYAYHPDQKKLIRLTQMDTVHDELNESEAEKDERRKHYLMPLEGIG